MISSSDTLGNDQNFARQLFVPNSFFTNYFVNRKKKTLFKLYEGQNSFHFIANDCCLYVVFTLNKYQALSIIGSITNLFPCDIVVIFG